MYPDVLQTGVESRYLSIKIWNTGVLLPAPKLQIRKESPKLGPESSLVTAPIEREGKERLPSGSPVQGPNSPNCPRKSEAQPDPDREAKAALFIPEICS